MRKILLVEDELMLQETYMIILATQPYVCDVADNGRNALEMCGRKTYDLILLDIMMPEMNGIEFLKLFGNEEIVRSKVIVMSNLSSGKDITTARELGVQKILLKSATSPSQLISTIRYHFGT